MYDERTTPLIDARAQQPSRWRFSTLVAGLALVAVAPAVAETPPVPGASTRVGGPQVPQAIVWRALDQLPRATIDAPRADRGYRAMKRAGMKGNRNPFSKLANPAPPIDLLVTLPVDPQRKVFEQRQALYLPPRARVAFTLKVPPSSRLRFGVGRIGRWARVEIDGNGKTLWKGRAPWHRWNEIEIDLGAFAEREITLSFTSRGTGHPLLADPVIIAPRPARPNVLLVMVDTLATWSVGCYGQPLPVTPNLDRLCREGTVFDHAIANSNWTRPSLLSLLSSWLPGKTGISYNRFYGLNIAKQRRRFYAMKPDLLPLLLRRRGYRSAALVNNLFMQGYHKYGLDHGFEQVVDYRHYSKDTRDITARALRWMEAHRRQRFFLMLNYNAPHVLYVPPRRHRREVRKMKRAAKARLHPKTEAYLGEVRYTDEALGRLLKGVDALGLAPNTLVILFADHGEVHDPKHAYQVVRTGRFSRFSHAVTLYDEEMRVPLVLRRPGVIPAGKRIAAQVPLLDLAPTIVEHLGLPASPRHDGTSFLNLIRGEPDAAERVALLAGRKMLGVRSEGFKYLRRLPRYQVLKRGRRWQKIAEELYDLRSDPLEHHNLASDPAHAERLGRLRKLTEKIP